MKGTLALVSKGTIWIVVPRFWMTLGVVLLVSAMVLTYHNDQTRADRVLATKVDLPDPVIIQEFDRAAHSNLLGELQLLAETDFDRSVVRQFGEGAARESYLMVPVHPVSRGGMQRAIRLASGVFEVTHRPVARPSAEMPGAPIAVLIYDVTGANSRARNAEAFGLTKIGRGFTGDLVIISGVVFSRALWSEGTTKAQVETAAREVFALPENVAIPLISPYVALRSAPGGTDMTEARNVLASMATIAILFGASLIARNLAKRPTLLKITGVRTPRPSASGRSEAFFDPLLPQDEIQGSDDEGRVTSQLTYRAMSRLRSRR